MAVEYTIDIQLTELGFPDVLQAREAPEAGPSTASVEHERGHQTGRQVTETGAARQSSRAAGASAAGPLPEASRCEQVNPALSPGDGQAARSEAALHDHTTGEEPPISGQEGGGLIIADEHQAECRAVDADSGDSEGSDGYEEEELEEDCVGEEGQSSDASPPGSYSCSVCHLQLPSSFKLKDHMNLHTGARPYCCAECGKRFCQTSSYRAHLRTHARTEVEPHRCRVCQKPFASEEDLTHHFSVIHPESTFFECDFCKRLFTCRKDCEKHADLLECLTRYPCDVCNRKFVSRKLLELHQKKCRRFFKCTDCSEAFTEKKALLKHSFAHLGLLPYTCVRCHQHFRLARLYCQHKCEPERIHCVACLREFSSHEQFQQHKKDTGCWGNQERGERAAKTEIRCLECGQGFESTEELKKHAGAHQRVLRCAECGKGFRSALLLMSHMGGHAGQSPCLCQRCGLGFPYQQNYNSHLKTCGRTLLPASATKKQQTSNSSSLETKTKDSGATAETSNVVSPVMGLNQPPHRGSPVNGLNKIVISVKPVTATLPASQEPLRLKRPAEGLNKALNDLKPDHVTSPVPQKGVSIPAPLILSIPASSSASGRLLKVPVVKPQPPGVDLVMFLPVGPPPASKLLLTSVVPPNRAPQTIPALRRTSVSALPTSRYFGASPALATQPNTRVAPLRGNEEDPGTPLDLSFKSLEKQKAKFPDGSVKVKLEEMEILEKSDVTKHSPHHVTKMLIETNVDGCTKVKKWRIEQIVPSSSDTSEPAESVSKKIKREVDI